MHDVVFVVANSDDEASQKIKAKWFGTPSSLHIDSWFVAENIDGFSIKIVEHAPKNRNNHLYFVNLGFYKSGLFGESHFMTLVIANSKSAAIEQAKIKAPSDKEMIHSDNIYDLDDCIKVCEVDDYYVELTQSDVHCVLDPTNGYIKLRDSCNSPSSLVNC